MKDCRPQVYFNQLKRLSGAIAATDFKGKKAAFADMLTYAAALISESACLGGKVFFIGNGASASIASHMAVDFWKNSRIPASSFNDAALLTCLSNDLGYERVFEKPLEVFSRQPDMLIAISSSGASKNIIRAAALARKKGLGLITLSGFKAGNPLRKMGRINFYVPASSYGFVEIMHHAICHCLADMLCAEKKKGKK